MSSTTPQKDLERKVYVEPSTNRPYVKYPEFTSTREERTLVSKWFSILCESHECSKHYDSLHTTRKYCFRTKDGSHYNMIIPDIVQWAREIVS